MSVGRCDTEIELSFIYVSRHAAAKKACFSPRSLRVQRIVNDLPRREGRIAKLCDSL